MKLRLSIYWLVTGVMAVTLVHPFIARSAETEPKIQRIPGGIAVEWRPKPITLEQEGASDSVFPDIVWEYSEDLENWKPTGRSIAGGQMASMAKQRLELPTESRVGFYRPVKLWRLAGMDLSGAGLAGLDLQGADLSGASLANADFTGANLRGADLRGADLSGASFTDADLRGANLILAKHETAQLSESALSEAIQTPEPDDSGSGESGIERDVVSGGGGTGFAGPPSGASGNIGFSTGGSKDINNFRENIANDYLPLTTDVTYEGLYYDYFFDTGQEESCEELFCPSYTQAISNDPLSGDTERYMAVGLNSGIQEADFKRKQLNLTLVLDVSGSMGSAFNRYYYDRFGNRVELEEGENKEKMEVASEAVAALLDHLRPEDRVAIVLFNNEARLLKPLTRVSEFDLNGLKDRVLSLEAGGGTAMSKGMDIGTAQYEEYMESDVTQVENRIIFLTDAQPNIGVLNENSLLQLTRDNADRNLYTTFIGIGVDFNTELVEHITKIRGANYYSVHSPDQFIDRMDDGFDHMVTPLVFNLQLTLNGAGYSIEKVYGSPEADEGTGRLMKVNTLFPSETEEGETRGGVVLLELKKEEGADTDGEPLTLSVSYEDRAGNQSTSEVEVDPIQGEPDSYENSGIRKAILLTRYANLLKNWIQDERLSYEEEAPVRPMVDDEIGIPIPIPEEEMGLGRWERQSVPLFVSQPYRQHFAAFRNYFEEESEDLQDETLSQELEVLETLSRVNVTATD